MEETYQSNTLDWSSLVFIIILYFSPFFSTSFSLHNFLDIQPIHFQFSAYVANDSMIMSIEL